MAARYEAGVPEDELMQIPDGPPAALGSPGKPSFVVLAEVDRGLEDTLTAQDVTNSGLVNNTGTLEFTGLYTGSAGGVLDTHGGGKATASCGRTAR